MERLHEPRSSPLSPLAQWFRSLRLAAERHGDIHHDNILDLVAPGWLAIDPKRVVGERGFDYTNLICNPEPPMSADSLRFERQIEIVAKAAG